MPQYQMRKKLDPGTITKYAKAYSSGALFPPIKIAVVDHEPMLVDGFHRLAAQQRIGRNQVEATLVTATKAEALALAAEANLRHGLPLKRSELKAVFKAMIKAGRHKQGNRLLSYRQLQELLGGLVPHTTIRHWMIKHFPKIARQYSGEAPVGARDTEGRDSDRAALTMARRAAEQALALVRGIRNPDRRGEVISFMEDALVSIRAGGHWTLPQPNDDF